MSEISAHGNDDVDTAQIWTVPTRTSTRDVGTGMVMGVGVGVGVGYGRRWVAVVVLPVLVAASRCQLTYKESA